MPDGIPCPCSCNPACGCECHKRLSAAVRKVCEAWKKGKHLDLADAIAALERALEG